MGTWIAPRGNGPERMDDSPSPHTSSTLPFGLVISCSCWYLMLSWILLPGSVALLLPLDLVSSFLDPCGPSSQDQTADGLGPTPHPLSGGRKYLLGPELSIAPLPLQPGICFYPRSSGLTNGWGCRHGHLPEQVNVSVAIFDLVIPNAPGALLATDDTHLLDLSCIQTYQREDNSTGPFLHSEEEKGMAVRCPHTR